MLASCNWRRRLLPLCVFLATFTIVMSLLMYSTDIRGRSYYRPLNLSLDSDLQNAGQDDALLVTYIQEHHLKPPPQSRPVNPSQPHSAASVIARIFGFKREGIFVETGVYREGRTSETEVLEARLGWRGLLTQPDPQDFQTLLAKERPRSHRANVCLSPTTNPKQVSFRQGAGNTASLVRIHCFPLFSLLLAYNATSLDLLSLHAERAELQVLKTLPFSRIHIKVISVVMDDENDDGSNAALLTRIVKLLSSHGYKLVRSGPSQGPLKYHRLAFICARNGHAGCSGPNIHI